MLAIYPSSIQPPNNTGLSGQNPSGPLASLEKGNSDLITANYPIELATDLTKTHYVTFSVKKVVPTSYSSSSSSKTKVQILGESSKALQSVLQNGANSIKNNIESGQYAGTTTGQILSNVVQATPDIVSRALATPVDVSPPTEKLKAIISLYMPDTIDARYNATYSEVELTSQLGKTITTLRTIDHVTGTYNQAKEKGSTAIAAALSADPAVVKAAIDTTGNFLGAGSELGEILLQGQGFAVNPQVQMIYKGLPLRSFALSFVFTPKSRTEAELVRNIIHLFKYHAAPELERGKTASTDSMFLIPPSLFNVQFMFKGGENKHLPKYDDCVLESIDVDYAPNGWTAHVDGAPVQTRLTLQFRELYIADRARLQSGFEGTDGGLR